MRLEVYNSIAWFITARNQLYRLLVMWIINFIGAKSEWVVVSGCERETKWSMKLMIRELIGMDLGQ